MKKIALILFAVAVIGLTVWINYQPQSDDSPLRKMAENAVEWKANVNLMKNWPDSGDKSVTYRCPVKEDLQYAVKVLAGHGETADPDLINIVVYKENVKGKIKELCKVSPYWNGRMLYFQTYDINNKCSTEDTCYITIKIKNKSAFNSVVTKSLGYGVVKVKCTEGGSVYSPFTFENITEIEMIDDIGGFDMCPDPEDGYLFRGFYYKGKKLDVYEIYDNQYALLYKKGLNGKTITAKFVPIKGKYKQLADTKFINMKVSDDYIVTWDTQSELDFSKYNILFYSSENPGYQIYSDTTVESFQLSELSKGKWTVEVTGEIIVDGQPAVTPPSTLKFEVK